MKHHLPIVKADYKEVMRLKEDMVTRVATVATSWRDYGGCYIVNGRYLTAAVNAGLNSPTKTTFASMVDISPTEGFHEAMKAWPDYVERELVVGDFRDRSTYEHMRQPVDASILYEVLLHQENYVEVIRHVIARTKRYVLISQPCLLESEFKLPAAAVLLQFYDEKTKDMLREGSFWPKEPPTQEYNPGFWMWGHTTSHLIAVMHGFGWKLLDGRIVQGCCGKHWECPVLCFERKPE